jgi:uncharacterized membrane protein YccF (DUF307 family)
MQQGNVVFVSGGSGPGLLVRVIWFLFIGWWVGFLWITLAYLFIVLIITIPIGVMMLNRVPQVMTLKARPGLTVQQIDGVTVLTQGAQRPQINILVRAVYFVFIGLWLGAAWVYVAYFLCLTIIGLPLAFWMFDRVPLVNSLRQ